MAAAPSGIITLLTDFGLADPFAGVMTGVILSRFPGARVVDLCHGIRPQAIAEGAFWLERCYRWFPPGTVHVAVVDPGVGSARRALAACIEGHYFVLPDNGLLGPALLESSGAQVLEVELQRLGLPPASATFHGRDVFAPLAAWIASGERGLAELGSPVRPLASRLPAPRVEAGRVRGEVITVDRFGNLITNLGAELVQALAATHALVAGERVRRARTYAEAAPGEPIALINSFDVLEIAVRDGDAERVLGASRNAEVVLEGRPEAPPHAG